MVEHYKETDRKSTFGGTSSHLTCEWWKLKDPTDVANAFNNFFIIFTEKLNIQQIEKRDAIFILKD